MWGKASLLLLAAGNANAFWRMQCHQPIVVDRIDPIVEPGVIPARHIHNVMGASGFSDSCSYDNLQQSDCTSCRVKGDNSVYWVPAMYFKHKGTGMMETVPQNHDMLVYYLPERGAQTGVKVQAFPPGFRMIAGDPSNRNYTEGDQPTEQSRRQQGIGFNCLNYTPGYKTEATLQRRKLPSNEEMKQCIDGLRADIAFPSCWNGKNDSPDHRSHMAYPTNVLDGTCPDTHPKRLVSIMFETTFLVSQFVDQEGEFVFSNGDATGYGYHGDFLAGWKSGLLEAAMEDPTCTPPITTATGGVIENCMTFVNGGLLQTDEEMGSCTIEQKAHGNFKGPMEALPGCNKISYGPEPAYECEENGTPSPDQTQAAKAAKPSKYTAPKAARPKAAKPASYAAPAPAANSVAPANLVQHGYNGAATPAAAPAVSPAAVPAVAPAPAHDDNVVVVVETVTQTLTQYAYAKRTAVPEQPHRRHAHGGHNHRRRRWF